MKYLGLSLFSSALILAAPVAAQDAEPEDEVIARGTIQTDEAMAAFLAGDFVTAEIEFEKNAMCALRVERNFLAGVESARDNAIRADLTAGANAAPQPSGGQGGAQIPSTPTAAPTSSFNSGDFQSKDQIARRTCDNRGFQKYMEGLSQIKLGKFEDAKESLTTAVFLRKDIHDAYFRLALLEFQDGKADKAKKHLKTLKKLERKCDDCEFKDDMVGQVSYLENLLN